MPRVNRKIVVDAVIFDLDGTLIDSAPIYYKIIDIIFERLSIPPVPKTTLLEAMKDGDFDWDYVLPVDKKSRKKELIDKAQGIIAEIALPLFRNQVKLIPGTVEALKAITSEGLRLALVTSSLREFMEVKLAPLRTAGIENLLEIVITADDVQHKKPHAEPLVICSEKLGVLPKHCLYVGDTRVDIKAGNAAGMQTVGVLTGFDDYAALKRETPDIIIDSIAELTGTINFDSSPIR